MELAVMNVCVCVRRTTERDYYNLVSVLVREPAVTAERKEEQCLRLTKISTKISFVVDWNMDIE